MIAGPATVSGSRRFVERVSTLRLAWRLGPTAETSKARSTSRGHAMNTRGSKWACLLECHWPNCAESGNRGLDALRSPGPNLHANLMWILFHEFSEPLPSLAGKSSIASGRKRPSISRRLSHINAESVPPENRHGSCGSSDASPWCRTETASWIVRNWLIPMKSPFSTSISFELANL